MTYLSKMANLYGRRYFVLSVLTFFITLVLYSIKNKSSIRCAFYTIVLNVIRCFGNTFTSTLMFLERNLSHFNRGPLTTRQTQDANRAPYITIVQNVHSTQKMESLCSIGNSICDHRAKFRIKIERISKMSGTCFFFNLFHIQKDFCV